VVGVHLAVGVGRLTSTLIGSAAIIIVLELKSARIPVLALVEILGWSVICRPWVRCTVRGRELGCSSREWCVKRPRVQRRRSLRRRIGRVPITAAARVAVDVGVEWRQSNQLLGVVLCLLIELLPSASPSHEPVGVGAVDVQVVADQGQPLHLEMIQLGDLDSRNIGPRSVDESVVIQELAAEDERHGQQSVDLVLALDHGGRKARESIVEVGRLS